MNEEVLSQNHSYSWARIDNWWVESWKTSLLVAKAILGNVHDAEDAAMNVFVKMSETSNSFTSSPCIISAKKLLEAFHKLDPTLEASQTTSQLAKGSNLYQRGVGDDNQRYVEILEKLSANNILERENGEEQSWFLIETPEAGTLGDTERIRLESLLIESANSANKLVQTLELMRDACDGKPISLKDWVESSGLNTRFIKHYARIVEALRKSGVVKSTERKEDRWRLVQTDSMKLTDDSLYEYLISSEVDSRNENTTADVWYWSKTRDDFKFVPLLFIVRIAAKSAALNFLKTRSTKGMTSSSEPEVVEANAPIAFAIGNRHRENFLKEIREEIDDCISRVPKHYQCALHAKYREGLDRMSICSKCKITLGQYQGYMKVANPMLWECLLEKKVNGVL